MKYIMIFVFLKRLHAELKIQKWTFQLQNFQVQSWFGSQKKTCPKEFLHLLFEDKCGIFTEFIAQYLLLKEKFGVQYFHDLYFSSKPQSLWWKRPRRNFQIKSLIHYQFHTQLNSMKISALLIFKRRLGGTPVVFFYSRQGACD